VSIDVLLRSTEQHVSRRMLLLLGPQLPELLNNYILRDIL